MRSRPAPWKAAAILLVLAALAWLFLRTVRDTLAEPYTIDGTELSGWTLVLQEPGRHVVARLALQPPPRMPRELFRQIFHRTMLSLTAPAPPWMPVVLVSEHAGSLDPILPADEMLDLARQAGLEQARFQPVCLAVKQEAYGGRSQQLFLLVLEAPAFSAFREELARLHEVRGGPGRFDPDAVVPVLPAASSDADLARWWPLEVEPAIDCQAPVEIAGGQSAAGRNVAGGP